MTGKTEAPPLTGRTGAASLAGRTGAAPLAVDGWFLLLVTVLALVVRLPYWRTIPAAGDEVKQAIYALQMVRERSFPLVGNDAYAGPFFFYLLALLIRMGVTDPIVGRAVVLVAGALTAPLTYAWARRLGERPLAGLIAAGVVVADPHLILLNSHVGGTTFLLPFLTLTFLWLLSKAVDVDHPGWLVASAAVGGLAVQSNPVAGLPVLGAWTWAAFRVRRWPQLGRRWPLWPLVAALCVVLVYSPVIVYNVRSGLDSITALNQRQYLWETNPTVRTFLSNEVRLAKQLVRQVSGVLVGDETFRSLVGMPLLYAAWMGAGLAFVTRRRSLLPLAVILPFFIALPYLSSHYGLIDPVRFTSLLTPVFAVGMGSFLVAALDRFLGLLRSRGIARSPILAGAVVLTVALVTYPLLSLFRYYAFVEENQQSGRALWTLSRQMARANQGEPTYISHSLRAMGVSGIPYVPRAHLVFADVHQEFLPPDRIIGRLFEFPGAAFLLISEGDAAALGQFARLARWPGAANEAAHRRGYGFYVLDPETSLTRPDFVLGDDDALVVAPRVSIGALFDDRIELIGYDAPGSVAAGDALSLDLYWRAAGSIPPKMYIGFVHLIDPATAALVAQDDHVLGRERYPVTAWRAGEIVVDRYVLDVPADAAPGEYALQVGVYTWPDLVRLDVPGHPDNVVELGLVDVGE